jgi:hypothetical protein
MSQPRSSGKITDAPLFVMGATPPPAYLAALSITGSAASEPVPWTRPRYQITEPLDAAGVRTMKKVTLSRSRLATLLVIAVVIGIVVGIAAVNTVLINAGMLTTDQIVQMFEAESLIAFAIGIALAIAVVVAPIWRAIRDAWMQRGMSPAERDHYQLERWDERGAAHMKNRGGRFVWGTGLPAA